MITQCTRVNQSHKSSSKRFSRTGTMHLFSKKSHSAVNKSLGTFLLTNRDVTWWRGVERASERSQRREIKRCWCLNKLKWSSLFSAVGLDLPTRRHSIRRHPWRRCGRHNWCYRLPSHGVQVSQLSGRKLLWHESPYVNVTRVKKLELLLTGSH